VSKELLGDFHGKDGESAYQLAVKYGFVGTEEQWLASFVSGDLVAHENDPTPHSAYDEIDLVTAYRLGKLRNDTRR
jgi:hypothetical protein